jgi:signal transduction histidine kinase/DNA-binding response OmpR family regulator
MDSLGEPRVGGRAYGFGAATLAAKVLIVDDDERNAFAAVQALETLGHELVVARSGEEALRKVLEDDFAVILLDLHMPGMDGYETAELLRSRRRTRDTPIVFLTAVFRDEAHLFQAYSAGAIDVVFKPVDPFILRSKVSLLVELNLKTAALRQEAETRLRLLDENARVNAEKLAAERKLRMSQERQAAILRSLPIVFHARQAAPPFTLTYISDNIEQLTGYRPERFVDEPDLGASRIHPEDVDSVVRAVSRALETGVYQCEYRWQAADGQLRSILDQGVLAEADDDGRPALFGTLIDNTDRRLLEEQLAHARRLEAVGQLTGGVAHDFNNLLTVVLGNVDMLTKPSNTARQQRQLDAIRHAAERGRDLTRQLLAFSRKQHLSPVVLDVNELLTRFLPLLQQAVGEAVTLTTQFPDEPLHVHVDAAQLESAILNLAVNARDAMPNGGAIQLSTRSVGDPGDQVEIEVADTGVGMPPDVLARIFDPFFTTKEVGKGSGLGLSQVYGFVSQSGGRVTADSRPGEGARVRLTLPRSELAADPMREERQVSAKGGSERLLVVEDDASVLSLTVEMLQGLGYRIVTASDATQALAIMAADEPFDLLFTDVVMPGGLSGLELARQARASRPEMKILLTSGYVGENAATAQSEFALLDKPYERDQLAAQLRALLDSPGESDPARRFAAE